MAPHAENATPSRHNVHINPASGAKLALPNIYADYKPRRESAYAEGHLSNTCVLSRRVNVWRHRVGALRRLRVMASAASDTSGGDRMPDIETQGTDDSDSNVSITYSIIPEYSCLDKELEADSANHLLDDYPVLKNWKMSPLLSVLGAFTGLFVGELIGTLVYASSVLWLLLGLAYIAMMIIYALVVYPSYFKEKPLVKSNRMISFLNFFVGGVIFGCIWNHNLTLSQSKETPHKGVSNIVYTVLEIIFIILLLLLASLFITQPTGSQENYENFLDASQPIGFWGHCKNLPDAPPLSISVKNGRVIDSIAKISFSVPKGWNVEPGDGSDGIRCYLFPENSKEGSSSYVICYSAYKMNEGQWKNLTEEDLEEALHDMQSSNPTIGIRSVEHGRLGPSNTNCWHLQARGAAYSDSRLVGRARWIFVTFYHDGIVYVFALEQIRPGGTTVAIPIQDDDGDYIWGRNILNEMLKSVRFQ